MTYVTTENSVTVENWLKENGIQLILIIGALVGVYTALETRLTKNEIIIAEIERHVKKQEAVFDMVPAIEARLHQQELETGELKPIMSDLAKSVSQLNITLVKFNGALDVQNLTVDTIKENQVRILNELDELKDSK